MTLAILFCAGSTLGWVLELLFRRFLSSANPERKWINPGFCTGPYVPLYGVGLCILYLISTLEKLNVIADPLWNRLLLFLVMALAMTAIEYAAGIMLLKFAKLRLWDYSNQWGNVKGIICPKFSAAWAILGAIYYFLIHPAVVKALAALSVGLPLAFALGVFYGVFIVDFVHSAQLVPKLRRFAVENGVIVRYEGLKESIRKRKAAAKQRLAFILPLKTDIPLTDHLRRLKDSFEKIKKSVPAKGARLKHGGKRSGK